MQSLNDETMLLVISQEDKLQWVNVKLRKFYQNVLPRP